ncbi:MAG: putative quinol monooxygenase [Acidimicrobiales bacterium]
MFALVVRFEVRPDSVGAFDALVSETLSGIADKEPGTVVYVNHVRADHPTERIFYECYRDEGAFDAHEAQHHTRRFLDERGQHLVREPEVWSLAPTEGVIAGQGVGHNGATDG